MNSKISNRLQFYRKHYFYPDLPKGYQITQYEGGGYLPLGVGGYLTLSNKKKIRIKRVHIEEDPAKLIHPSGMGESKEVLIDYNRSGNPLIEVVTEPDLNTPDEAKEFLDKLRRLLLMVGVLDPQIDVTIRTDANISLGKSARIEIKNIGSSVDVEKAISFEIVRLKNYLVSGVEIIQETRHWDDRRRVTVSLREKEFEEEYRYFPDPNIPTINLEMLYETAFTDFPKLEDEIINELTEIYKIREDIAVILGRNPELYELFIYVVERVDVTKDPSIPNLIGKIIVNEGLRLIKENLVDIYKLGKVIVNIINLVMEGVLSEGEARKRLLHRYLDKKKLTKVDDEVVINSYIDKILGENYLDFENLRVRDFIVGRALKLMEEDGFYTDPSIVASLVEKKISSRLRLIKDRKVAKVVYSKPSSYESRILPRKISVLKAFELKSGECVLVGWLESKMIIGGKAFVILRDWSGKLQCVIERGISAYDKALTIPREAFIMVKGILYPDIRAPGGVELRVSKITHLGGVSPPPLSLIDLARSNVSTRIKFKYLDIRRKYVSNVMSFRSKLLRVIRDFFYEKGFMEINTPKIITTATEGGAELFPILFYGREAFLAQSPQLYKQMALNMFEKVFEIDSYYRAQKYDTPRHLAEFWSIDVEASLFRLDDLLSLIEDLVLYCLKRLNIEAEKELNVIGIKLPELSKPFHKIEYLSVLEYLRTDGMEIAFGDDLGAEELRLLSKKFSGPYFIINWPKTIRAFYYKPHPDDDRLTLSFDFIWPLKNEVSLELASGGERINDVETLAASLKEKGLYPEAYEWYVDMFRYGMPPHGGFGLGLDRLVMALLGLRSILDSVFSPRTPKYNKP